MADLTTQILENRAAETTALRRPDLIAARAEIQEAYRWAAHTARAAAAKHRYYGDRADPNPAVVVTGLNRYAARIGEADAAAVGAEAEYRRLFDAYHDGLRPTALAEAGWDVALAVPTPEELEQRRAFEENRLLYPPLEWGTTTPSYARRCARWQTRPAHERLSDPRPRGPSTYR